LPRGDRRQISAIALITPGGHRQPERAWPSWALGRLLALHFATWIVLAYGVASTVVLVSIAAVALLSPVLLHRIFAGAPDRAAFRTR
jgi:hypothetical protein